ncbi:MAG TPA: hypothetical protein VF823_05855, partial [Anaerolineales bacterium]
PAPVPTASPTSLPSPTPAAALPAPGTILTPTLTSLHMLDENQGWGLTAQNVLRTSDGGVSWTDVTPPGFGGPAYPQGFFLDAQTAWIVGANGQDFYSGLLYHTLDAGKTWTSGKVPFSGASLDFLDTKVGWALFASDCGAGSCGGSLFHTTDGGLTWSELLKINQDSNANPKAIPLSGDKSGIAFADPNHGWVGGTEPVDDYTYLFATQDGGSTWQPVALKLPAGSSPAQVMVDPPHFFSPKDGLLPIHIFSGNRSLELFYVTQDAGITWTPSTPTDISGVYAFISIKDIWVWDGQTMQVTTDGGKTWATVTPNVNLSQTITQLDFVTKDLGWVITMDADGKGRLLKTQDGGRTWAPLH